MSGKEGTSEVGYHGGDTVARKVVELSCGAEEGRRKKLKW